MCRGHFVYIYLIIHGDNHRFIMEDGVSFLRLPIAFLKSQLKDMLKMQVPGPAADLLAQKISACTKDFSLHKDFCHLLG